MMVTILVISIILIVAPASGENQDSASEAEMFSMIRANGDFTPAGSNKVGIEALGDSAEVSVSSATGYASFVRIEAGALHSNLDAGASAVEKADAFLADYGDIFGISDASRELSLASVETTLGGIEHVSYLQNYEGIPVYAGVLRVHFNAAGELFAANGDFVPDISVRTSPALTASEAEAAAVSATALGSSTRAAKVDLTASDAELVIYRTGLVQGISGESYLAYEVEVTDSAGTVREFVFVDAQSGAVLDSFSGIHEDLDREISETSLANVVWDESEGDPEPIPAGWAGGTAQQVTDWNNEIDGAKETYNLFMSMASRDSYDGAGATMRTVNNDPNISCPNAQWNGISTNYCTDV
ncbi:MAG: PepSY domain-containing protein, partial [Candidatus Promineifilaceae bacterium]